MPSIYTKKQQRQRNNKDGGGKQMKRRRRYATVTDLVHGVPQKAGHLPQVRVPIPRNKREQFMLGSPFSGK